MVSRRLLIILIIFILVGGIGIAAGQIFVVRHITPYFRNSLAYITQEDYAKIKSSIQEELSGMVLNRSILFSVDRNRIMETLEDIDYRVRVTNVEAVFPNTLRIRMRERYPVFTLVHEGQRLILDSQLRFVTKDYDYYEDLICLDGQIDIPSGETPQLGDFLEDFFDRSGDFVHLTQLMRIDRIVAFGEFFFWEMSTYEDSLTHIFEFFEFERYEATDLFISFSDAETTIRIRDIRDPVLFIYKIDLVWDVMADRLQRPNDYTVELVNNRPQVVG